MGTNSGWRTIVASSLAWDQAHVTLERATDGLAPELRGKRPDNFPHSVWELLEHIRLTQYDLLDFMRNSAYVDATWPDDYWPPTPAPPSAEAWNESLARIKLDRSTLEDFTTGTDLDLTSVIPHAQHGQTYLRTVLVAVDHTSYHVAQIVAVRRLIGAWQ